MNQRRGAKVGVGAVCAAVVAVGLQASAYAVSAQANSWPSAAGYFAFTSSASTSAGVTFKVPTVQCSSKLSWVAFGAFIVPVTSLGRLTAAAAVTAECLGGSNTTPIYSAFIEAAPFGFRPGFTPRAGDYVTVSAETSASTGINVTFRDRTQSATSVDGSSEHPTGTLVALGGIVASPGNTPSGWLPVPNFGRVIYTDGTINGATAATANGGALDMKSGKDTQIHTGVLFTTGDAWTEIFKAST